MLNYAENIKRIRKRKNYTQAELAAGIASQGMISKIEKKQLSPDIDLLEAIAKKLDCSLMELLSDSNDSKLNQIYSYINKLVKLREYKLLDQFVNNEPMIKIIKVENKPYYHWVQGIIFSEIKNDYKNSIKEMELALSLSKDPQLSIRVLVGLSALYSEVKQYDKSIDHLLEASTLSEQEEVELELKQSINFQIARMYSVMEDFNKSIFYNRIAIQFAVDQDSLYLLDDLHLLLADSYLRTEQVYKAQTNIDFAKAIAKVKSNNKLLPYIELTKQQIREKI